MVQAARFSHATLKVPSVGTKENNLRVYLPPIVYHNRGERAKHRFSQHPERNPMKKKKGHQRSRLRVDPFNLLQQLCEQDCTLSELQQRTGFDPAEIKPLRAAGKIHLDTLNRIAAGLDVSPNSLLITATSPWKAYHGDYANQTCGFSDAFNVLADYSPYDLGPLFK